MSEFLVQEESLINIANAIRTKNETEDQLNFPNDFIKWINNINTDQLSKLFNASEVIVDQSKIYSNKNQYRFSKISSENVADIKCALIISNNYLEGINLTAPEVSSSLSYINFIFQIKYNGIFGIFVSLKDGQIGIYPASKNTGIFSYLNSSNVVGIAEIYLTVNSATNSNIASNQGYTNLDPSDTYTGYFII